MNLLTENIQIVMDYLSDNNATKTACALHRECYKRLESHFKEKGKDFSCEEADAWCEDLSLCRVTIRKYKGAIQRLVDVFQTGKVRFCHRIRITLDDQYENVISAYLSHASVLYSDTHLMNIRRRCRFFSRMYSLKRKTVLLTGSIIKLLLIFPGKPSLTCQIRMSVCIKGAYGNCWHGWLQKGCALPDLL